jgi:hypothetical protein
VKGRKGMNLFAVVAAVIFLLVYTVPTLRNAVDVDTCLDQGGRWVHSEGVCEQ